MCVEEIDQQSFLRFSFRYISLNSLFKKIVTPHTNKITSADKNGSSLNMSSKMIIAPTNHRLLIAVSYDDRQYDSTGLLVIVRMLRRRLGLSVNKRSATS